MVVHLGTWYSIVVLVVYCYLKSWCTCLSNYLASKLFCTLYNQTPKESSCQYCLYIIYKSTWTNQRRPETACLLPLFCTSDKTVLYFNTTKHLKRVLVNIAFQWFSQKEIAIHLGPCLLKVVLDNKQFPETKAAGVCMQTKVVKKKSTTQSCQDWLISSRNELQMRAPANES